MLSLGVIFSARIRPWLISINKHYKLENTDSKWVQRHRILITSNLKTIGQVVLPPNKATVFNCKVPHDTPSGTYMARFLDNAKTLADHPSVSIANIIVKVDTSKQIALLAVNETGSRHVIPARSGFALIEHLEEREINEISIKATPERENKAKPEAVELTLEQAQQLNDIIARFDHIFAESDLELGFTDLVQCHIDTGDAHPIKQRPCRIPFLQRPLIEEHLAKMLAADIIRPSTSPWASPIVIVDKNDKSKRFCVDFRKKSEQKECPKLLSTASDWWRTCVLGWSQILLQNGSQIRFLADQNERWVPPQNDIPNSYGAIWI